MFRSPLKKLITALGARSTAYPTTSLTKDTNIKSDILWLLDMATGKSPCHPCPTTLKSESSPNWRISMDFNGVQDVYRQEKKRDASLPKPHQSSFSSRFSAPWLCWIAGLLYGSLVIWSYFTSSKTRGYKENGNWLVVHLPLWKIWVRQLGLLFPIYIYMENEKCSKPPTRKVKGTSSQPNSHVLLLFPLVMCVASAQCLTFQLHITPEWHHGVDRLNMFQPSFWWCRIRNHPQ